jgi:hypothetical protein
MCKFNPNNEMKSKFAKLEDGDDDKIYNNMDGIKYGF